MPVPTDRTVSKATTATRTAAPGDWISQLTIEHGPVDLLGRFFLAADAALRQRGITLSLGTFDELVDTNLRNRDSWRPLMPIYSPDFNTFTDDNSFVFLGRNANGDVVATQVGRLLRLAGTTYADYTSSLRLTYRDPPAMKLADERCIVTAPTMQTMTGKVLYGGAVWYHPSVRKLGLGTLTPRISRAYAHTRWNLDYATAFIVDGALKGGLGKNAGYPNVEWGVKYENTRMGDAYAALCWMDIDYLLGDLSAFLADVGSEVDAGVGNRRAQK